MSPAERVHILLAISSLLHLITFRINKWMHFNEAGWSICKWKGWFYSMIPSCWHVKVPHMSCTVLATFPLHLSTNIAGKQQFQVLITTSLMPWCQVKHQFRLKTLFWWCLLRINDKRVNFVSCDALDMLPIIVLSAFFSTFNYLN